MGFQNLVQARLRRDLKAQRQLGLPKPSPAFLSLIRVNPAHPWLKMILPSMILPTTNHTNSNE
jgi:hypothetical protein